MADQGDPGDAQIETSDVRNFPPSDAGVACRDMIGSNAQETDGANLQTVPAAPTSRSQYCDSPLRLKLLLAFRRRIELTLWFCEAQATCHSDW